MIAEIKEADRLINEIDKNNEERIERLYTRLTKTTSNISKDVVQSSPKAHSREEALLLLAEMTKEYSEARKKLKELYNKTEDRDLKIYLDKYYLLSGSAYEINRALEIKYGLTKRQIQRICKKVEKKHEMSR